MMLLIVLALNISCFEPAFLALFECLPYLSVFGAVLKMKEMMLAIWLLVTKFCRC